MRGEAGARRRDRGRVARSASPFDRSAPGRAALAYPPSPNGARPAERPPRRAASGPRPPRLGFGARAHCAPPPGRDAPPSHPGAPRLDEAAPCRGALCARRPLPPLPRRARRRVAPRWGLPCRGVRCRVAPCAATFRGAPPRGRARPRGAPRRETPPATPRSRSRRADRGARVGTNGSPQRSRDPRRFGPRQPARPGSIGRLRLRCPAVRAVPRRPGASAYQRGPRRGSLLKRAG